MTIVIQQWVQYEELAAAVTVAAVRPRHAAIATTHHHIDPTLAILPMKIPDLHPTRSRNPTLTRPLICLIDSTRREDFYRNGRMNTMIRWRGC